MKKDHLYIDKEGHFCVIHFRDGTKSKIGYSKRETGFMLTDALKAGKISSTVFENLLHEVTRTCTHLSEDCSYVKFCDFMNWRRKFGRPQFVVCNNCKKHGWFQTSDNGLALTNTTVSSKSDAIEILTVLQFSLTKEEYEEESVKIMWSPLFDEVEAN